MPTACCERIAAGVQAALQTISTISGLQVERNRRDPLKEDELPRLLLFEIDEVDDTLYVGEDGYAKRFGIQGAISGTAAGAAQSANALRAEVIRALKADVSLGGLARDLVLDDTGAWIGIDAASDTPMEGFQLTAAVRYATVFGDPYTFF
jgi:hypothetical protein